MKKKTTPSIILSKARKKRNRTLRLERLQKEAEKLNVTVTKLRSIKLQEYQAMSRQAQKKLAEFAIKYPSRYFY